MADIVKLATREQTISQEVVEILESYLAMAKKGEIVCIAIAGVAPDGSGVHQASASDKQVTLLGVVGRLLHRMNLVADETMIEEPEQ